MTEKTLPLKSTLTPEEVSIVKECLLACLEFFDDDWEFQLLFGVEKTVNRLVPQFTTATL
jgi:hypothetical protein